ncbi:MAG: polysaccharide biosynthesis/export family protein [Bacteroidetes bacterium]|jgi:polysaccharide export outer membrane protein|nr:polysaccharide biosynthesis/export family protein [Bacteroidota bacterium]MDF1867830.1 polysaccharide biosynthesis/export family protein [Saprospiraceae bacterium]
MRLIAKKGLLLVLIGILLFSSCVPHQQLLSFRKVPEFITIDDHDINNYSRLVIKPDDILYIQVMTFDKILAEPFNLISITQQANLSGDVTDLQGYLVSSKGNIEFPVLGTIQVGNLTTDELREKLKALLVPYLDKPVINVRVVNFTISVLGEVNIPGTFSVRGERITILESLGLAGDFTPYSNKDVVMVMREVNNERTFGYLDLRSPEVFKSPYFYLKQNDVVYIEPIKEKTATVRDPVSEVLPIVTGIISIGALFIALLK